MQEPYIIKVLNRRLGEELGFGPLGPRFKWAHSTDLFYYWRPDPGVDFQRICWADKLAIRQLPAPRITRRLTAAEMQTLREESLAAIRNARPVKTWMLAQWRPPAMTFAEFWTAFGGRYEYPAKGMYYAHPETRLNEGDFPDMEITRFILDHGLKQQLAMTEWDQNVAANREAQQTIHEGQSEFMDFVADWEPAFQNYGVWGNLPGDKPHVSYGGV